MKRFMETIVGCLILAASAGSVAEQARPGLIPRHQVDGGLPSVGRVNAGFGRMPLSFIPNEGQIGGDAVYYAVGRDTSLYFEPSGVIISLTGSDATRTVPPAEDIAAIGTCGKTAPEIDGAGGTPHPSKSGHSRPGRWNVKLDFLDAAVGIRPVGDRKTGAVISYFKGNRDEWKPGLPAYSRIVYRDLWPGIDLAYEGGTDCLKYEFVVRPGADPAAIRLAYRGASCVALGADGRLEVATPLGGFHDQAPVAYQERSGRRVSVPASFRLQGQASPARSSAFGFAVGAYDPTLPLVIDPATVIYCGFLGGAADDRATAVAIDGSGNAYLTGRTASLDFPVTVGPDLTFNDTAGKTDAFVAKVSADGASLVYCGFLGGIAEDVGSGIAVDSAGNTYISGWTYSSDFPLIVGPSLMRRADISQFSEAFVTKVSADGASLLYSGFIGGSKSDQANAIAVDTSGNAYVAGWTESSDFPRQEQFGRGIGGASDAFAAKISPDGASLLYAGYIGGKNADGATGIAVDSSGNAYLTGYTNSSRADWFPARVGPSLTYGGNQDAFVAEIDAVGSQLVFCGYIGGPDFDSGAAVAVDSTGDAYVCGTTRSQSGFPVAGGPGLVHRGGDDAFVAKVKGTNAALVYSGFIGGSGDDQGQGIAVDVAGHAFVVGTTESASDFPVTGGPSLVEAGLKDVFVATVADSGESLTYGGFIGGSDDDKATGVVTDGSGNLFIAGTTHSLDFPVSVGPSLTPGSEASGVFEDAFVARISEDLPPASPVNLHVAAVATAEINLAWTDRATIETGFKLERRSDPLQPWTEIATLEPDVTAYADTGLQEGTPYDYRIRSFNASGNSMYGADCLQVTRPFPASNLTATVINERRIDLAWTDNSSREEEYLVERALDAAGPWYTMGVLGPNTTTLANTIGVFEDTTYFYRIFAVTASVQSTPSNIVSVTTPPLTLPAAPSDLQATALSAHYARVSWVNNAYNADGFMLEMRTGADGTWEQVGIPEYYWNWYEVGFLMETTTYYFRVHAFNKAGNSAYSNEASVTTPPTRPRIYVQGVDFGTVVECVGYEGTVTIGNSGDGPLTVNAITFASGSTEFVYLNPAPPFTIPISGYKRVYIGFFPQGAKGQVSAAFTVKSNDPTNPSVAFAAQGSGTIPLATAQLTVARGVVRAWTAQMEYARVNVSATLSTPESAVTFRLMRKSGSAFYQAVKVFTWADTVGGEWAYMDTYLSSGTSYSYKIEAVDCRGQVIAESQETAAGVLRKQLPAKGRVLKTLKGRRP